MPISNLLGFTIPKSLSCLDVGQGLYGFHILKSENGHLVRGILVDANLIT